MRQAAQNVIEYGLLIASIVVVVLIGVTRFGSVIEPWFASLAGSSGQRAPETTQRAMRSFLLALGLLISSTVGATPVSLRPRIWLDRG